MVKKYFKRPEFQQAKKNVNDSFYTAITLNETAQNDQKLNYSMLNNMLMNSYLNASTKEMMLRTQIQMVKPEELSGAHPMSMDEFKVDKLLNAFYFYSKDEDFENMQRLLNEISSISVYGKSHAEKAQVEMENLIASAAARIPLPDNADDVGSAKVAPKKTSKATQKDKDVKEERR